MALKHCEVCGKEFIDYGRGKYCHNPHYKTCVICGKTFPYDVRAQKIPETCSPSCRMKLARTRSKYSAKICQKCGAEYTPTSSKQKYCPKCR